MAEAPKPGALSKDQIEALLDEDQAQAEVDKALSPEFRQAVADHRAKLGLRTSQNLLDWQVLADGSESEAVNLESPAPNGMRALVEERIGHFKTRPGVNGSPSAPKAEGSSDEVATDNHALLTSAGAPPAAVAPAPDQGPKPRRAWFRTTWIPAITVGLVLGAVVILLLTWAEEPNTDRAPSANPVSPSAVATAVATSTVTARATTTATGIATVRPPDSAPAIESSANPTATVTAVGPLAPPPTGKTGATSVTRPTATARVSTAATVPTPPPLATSAPPRSSSAKSIPSSWIPEM